MSPKTSTLIQERKARDSGNTGSVYTYHGQIGVLDCHDTFSTDMEDWSAMYDLDMGVAGKPTVSNATTISNKLKNYF